MSTAALAVTLCIAVAIVILSLSLRAIAKRLPSFFSPPKFLRPSNRAAEAGAGPIIAGWVETGPEYFGRAARPLATSLPLTRTCLIAIFLGIGSTLPVLHFQARAPWLVAVPIVAGGIWAAIWETRAQKP